MLWPQFHSWVGEICWRRDKLPTPVFLGFPGGSTGKESARNAQDPSSVPGLERSAGEEISCPLQYSWAFLCGLAGKESTFSMGDLGLIPGLGRSPGERKDYPFQYFGLENSMECTVHGVTKRRTWLSDLKKKVHLVAGTVDIKTCFQPFVSCIECDQNFLPWD